MADLDSTPSNDKKLEQSSLKRKRSVTDQTGNDLDVVSSDDEFVSDGDSDLGFLSDDAADLFYLSATRTDNYSGLDITQEGPEGPWIRLLRLHPAQYHEPLSGALVRRPLYEGTIEYVALSYSWKQGFKKVKKKNMPTSALKLQYHVIDISEHLVCALRRLRDERSFVYVWVDAICVNQRDFGEKASQIPLMDQIYANAAQVFIWLGEPPADFQKDNACWVFTQHRPWWSRLWVVQECIHSTQCPIVLLGSRRFQLNQFVEKLSSMEVSYELGPSQVTTYLRDLYEAWSKHEASASTHEPLLRRLLQTKHLKCKDFHDRVYALLSLVPKKDAACFVVDYLKSDYELAAEMFTALLGADAWSYGDFQLGWDSVVQLREQSLRNCQDAKFGWDSTMERHEQSLRGRQYIRENASIGDEGDSFPGAYPRLDVRIAAYEHMINYELDNMCVESIVESKLVTGSRFSDLSDLSECAWIHKLLCDWWSAKLFADGTPNMCRRLCSLYYNLPVDPSERHGVYEWTTSSGICGVYFSPYQSTNAKVLLSMHQNMGLVIDDERGTFPCYVLSNPVKQNLDGQKSILLDFDSPSRWSSYEPPKRRSRLNLSESLSLIPAKPTEDGLAIRQHYVVGLRINSRGPDARSWEVLFANGGCFNALKFTTAIPPPVDHWDREFRRLHGVVPLVIRIKLSGRAQPKDDMVPMEKHGDDVFSVDFMSWLDHFDDSVDPTSSWLQCS